MNLGSIGEAEVLGHVYEAYDEFLHPVEGLLVFAEFVGQLHDLKLKLFDLFLE